MKIYLRSAVEDKSVLDRINRVIKKKKHLIDISTITSKSKDDYTSKDAEKIPQYDLFIAEASAPSAKLGYEVAFAIEKNIPTIVLYSDEDGKKGFFPFMALNPKTKLIIKGYKIKDVEGILDAALSEMSDYLDSRFTLNLTPQISDFLNWVSATKKVTRTDFIRGLIESALKKSTEYKKYLKKRT